MDDNTEKAIIIALCRCAMANNPNNAIKHNIERLRKYHSDKGNSELSETLRDILSPQTNYPVDFKIVKS